MGKVPPEAQAEWLRAEQAYLFSHEGGGKWKDRSREFREYCLSMAAQHTGALISQKKWPEVLSLVEAVDRRGQADYLLLYHYAFSLQQLGRFREAVAAYERSLSLEPGYAYAWLNLGLSHHALGDRRQGCRELDRARAAKSSDPAPAARWAELCRGT
jgi:tetratricopeptide (TPR) repeat protein